MGANQFDEPKDQERFFNWFFFTMYFFFMVSCTGVVYAQDNVSWGVGYGICLVASFIGMVAFVSGNKFYRHDKPQGSPFPSLARVVVASIRKVSVPNKIQHHTTNGTPSEHEPPLRLTHTLRFFNKAAIEIEGDTNPDGSIAKPWRLCTVQQVEDFKKLLKILPIWSTGIMVSVSIAILCSLTILQAIAMDRYLGHFKIPACSILVLSFISTFISLTCIDRYFPFLWQKVMRRPPTAILRIGIGYVLTSLSIGVSALVEKRRLGMNNNNEKMLVVWLFPQLIIAGIGEAFCFPGQVAFYYQEFPASLRSTATAMSSLVIGIGYYLSTSFVDIVQACTEWLPNDINHGRVDDVFWVLVVLRAINFVYFLGCAKYFKYEHRVDKPVVETVSNSTR